MNTTHDHDSLKQIKIFTKVIVFIDIVINIATGILLLVMPISFDLYLFQQQIIAPWIYRLIAIGFVFFAGWQLLCFIQPGGFTVWNLRFAALLAWLPIVALTMGLLSNIGDHLLALPKLFLWLANIYMLLLGGLYWCLTNKVKR